MTNLINTITINGQSTTFLNYVNPVVSAESYAMTDANCRSVLTTAWGASKVVVYSSFLTALLPPGDLLFTGTAGVHNNRFDMYSFGTIRFENYINSSTNSASRSYVQALDPQFSLSASTHTFGVINPFGFIFASFTSDTRATLNSLILRSWLKNGIFTGNQRTRNVVGLDFVNTGVRTFFRPSVENTTTRLELLTQNPSLLCAIATPGANASEIIVRDSVSPNNYIGQLWNMIMMPSSCVVGKIYKNTGIDPDTGQIETDQKAFWMCLGSWGANKIGMRVWTEDIT